MTIQEPAIQSCSQCGTQLAAMMLVCPGCGRLAYADRLAELAHAAREATDLGDIQLALQNWREALELLPRESRQHQVISAKITELGTQLTAGPIPPKNPAGKQTLRSRLTAGISAIALGTWKLKALLLGLTKATTLLTMFVSFSVYWTIWGWRFALGIVLSIYVHEMGHVIALRRLGFKASAPMFIPGLGAVIRLQQQVVNPNEDAEIGLAGPIYGLGASLVALAIWLGTRLPIFAAIAGVGAWINLFNLIPVWTLDGGRGYHAMSRQQKVLAAASAAVAWYFTRDGMAMLLAIVGLYRAFSDKKTEGNWKPTITYIALVAALSAVSHFGMPQRLPH